MCGLAGIVRLGERPFDPHVVKRMCDVIAHRGPDDAGYAFFHQRQRGKHDDSSWLEFADPEFRHFNEHLPPFGGDYCERELARQPFDLALGHRRLSILDLSAYGHQPMSNSNRQYWVAYNGETYNFPSLRAELADHGHVFRSGTDTEVLLHLWEEEGASALPRLDGMFALALFDRRRGQLTLARDRWGIKPLYYAVTKDFLVFGSESKALLASGLIERQLNPDVLAEYMTFQNAYGDETVFDGVKVLPPGHTLTLQVGRGGHDSLELAPYVAPCETEVSGDDLETASGKVAELFARSVHAQLISDVPVGSYLSGGMDSGSIVSVAGRHIPRLHTFTGGFDLTNVDGIEQGFDERQMAERLSHLLQTEHYDVVLHSGDMPAAMEQICWHVDDPRVGMCHQNWYVAKLASRFVKVCLAGAGGDELFGGYPWRYRQGMDGSSEANFDDLYFRYWHRLLPPEELPALFAPGVRGSLAGVRDRFQAVLATAPEPAPGLDKTSNLVRRALHFGVKTFLHGFLVVEDRISMAHSLETRLPFLDNALFEYAQQLTPALKLDLETMLDHDRAAHMVTAEGKLVLRKAMEQYLPPEFTQQRKQGFSPPDANWYRGPSMDYIKDVLYDPRSRERPWFDQGFVKGRLEEHFSGQRNHRLLIWSLLVVEWLQRHFIDGEVQRPNAHQSPGYLEPRRNLG